MTVPGDDSGEKAHDVEHTSAQPDQDNPPSWTQPSGFEPPPGPPGSGYPPPNYPPPNYPPPNYPPPPGHGAPGYQDPSVYGGSYPPPPPEYGTSAPGYPQPYPSGYPLADYPGSYGQPQQSGTNTLAIASLVSSCIGLLCGIGAIVGIVLGAVALNQVKQTRQQGYGLAIAGIVVGIATLLINLIFTIYALR